MRHVTPTGQNDYHKYVVKTKKKKPEVFLTIQKSSDMAVSNPNGPTRNCTSKPHL